MSDSDGLRDAQVVTEHTFFVARLLGVELDLTAKPWSTLRALWRDDSDYSACQQLAGAARAHASSTIAAIRDESARRETAACEAVFQVAALSLPARRERQAWMCKTTRQLVMLSHDSEAFEYSFT